MAQLPVNKIEVLTQAQRDAQTSKSVGDLIFNSTSGSLEVNKDGATTWDKLVDSGNLSGEQLVYISNSGSDSTGDGSQAFPYASASYALSQITDNSSSKPYKIVFMPGVYTDTTIAIKNYIYFEGNESTWTVTNPIVLDSSFSAGGMVYINNFYLIYNIAGSSFDFNSLTPSTACTLNFNDCGLVIPSFTVIGAASNQCILNTNNLNAGGTTFTLSNCVFTDNDSDIYRIIYTKNSAAQPNQSVKLYGSFVSFTSSITVSAAETIVLRSWGSKWLNTLTLTTTGSGIINADSFASQYDVAPSLSGAGVTFTTAPLSVTPSVAAGATVTYRTIADTIYANSSRSNYTPSSATVEGNFDGINTSLGGKVTSVTGTADQVIVAGTATDPVLSLPQSIATTSTVTFAALHGNGSVDLDILTPLPTADTDATGILIAPSNGNASVGNSAGGNVALHGGVGVGATGGDGGYFEALGGNSTNGTPGDWTGRAGTGKIGGTALVQGGGGTFNQTRAGDAILRGGSSSGGTETDGHAYIQAYEGGGSPVTYVDCDPVSQSVKLFKTTNISTLTASALVTSDASKNLVSGNLSGDVTTSGGLATTLATVNGNVGSFTNANITVNAKGLVTAASNGSAAAGRLLNVQVITAAGPSTYTPTAGTNNAIVYLTGGGGGGGGAGVAGTGQTNGGTGGTSSFGAIFSASGGAGGVLGTSSVSGNGGVGSASAGGTYVIPGGGGTTGYLCGGAGGSSYAGGGAAAKAGNTQTGYNASANSGGGGGGGTYVSYAAGGGGGGATGVYYYTSVASQTVTIGAGGTGGTAGTAGGAGGDGGSGICVIFEYS